MVNNQTLKFLLPIISNRSPHFYLRDEFVGSFVGDVDRPDKDGSLSLVYKYPRTIEWAEFEGKLKDTDAFAGDYDYEEKQYVIYNFSLEECEEDFQYVLNGQYSKISPESKLKIVKFWETYSHSTLPKKIMEVDESLLDSWKTWNKNPEEYCEKGELWWIPELDKEIFNIKTEY